MIFVLSNQTWGGRKVILVASMVLAALQKRNRGGVRSSANRQSYRFVTIGTMAKRFSGKLTIGFRKAFYLGTKSTRFLTHLRSCSAKTGQDWCFPEPIGSPFLSVLSGENENLIGRSNMAARATWGGWLFGF
ncbi:MAG TPA: hypothetical protein DCF63_05015 [Planctomycetaceae bacterium]|nr:hypothetical protein [Planctomycetaceae bacterium]